MKLKRLTEREQEITDYLKKKYESLTKEFDEALLKKEFLKSSYFRGQRDLIVDLIEFIES